MLMLLKERLMDISISYYKPNNDFLDQVKMAISRIGNKENSEEGSDAYAIFVAELSGNKDIPNSN
jgi:hypothetical protein